MKATGTIICTRTPVFGVELKDGTRPLHHFDVKCEWQGGRIGLVTGVVLREGSPEHIKKLCENVCQIAQYKVRILGIKPSVSGYYDTYYMMQEGWLAVAAHTYIFCMRKLLAGLAQIEWMVRRLFGEDTSGKYARVAGFVGQHLPFFPL